MTQNWIKCELVHGFHPSFLPCETGMEFLNCNEEIIEGNIGKLPTPL
jgi:hypothetical protein